MLRRAFVIAQARQSIHSSQKTNKKQTNKHVYAFYEDLGQNKALFRWIRQSQVGGRFSHLSLYVGLDLTSAVYPSKISRISNTLLPRPPPPPPPRNKMKFLQPKDISSFCTLADSNPNDMYIYQKELYEP